MRVLTAEMTQKVKKSERDCGRERDRHDTVTIVRDANTAIRLWKTPTGTQVALDLWRPTITSVELGKSMVRLSNMTAERTRPTGGLLQVS